MMPQDEDISLDDTIDRKLMNVNLDALIERANFSEPGSGEAMPNRGEGIISLNSLAQYHKFYRKPDFQRETNQWAKEQIGDLIESFLNTKLIPAIILWHSKTGSVFVIDGAHRLSALMSWVFDDYGYGKISKRVYEGDIPADMQDEHAATKKYIEDRIGAYAEPSAELEKKIFNSKITVQWMDESNISAVEQAFFRINRQGIPLDTTEISLLQNREGGNCIAARAIIRAGAGHKYWDKFDSKKQFEIESVAKKINNILFTPQAKQPQTSINAPIGGSIGHVSSLALVMDLVNIINKKPTNAQKIYEGKSDSEVAAIKEKLKDKDGSDTIKCLKRTLDIVQIICDEDPSSLGLFCLLYFYGADGKHQTSAVLGITQLILEFEHNKSLYEEFLNARGRIEIFMSKYRVFINQIIRKYGQGLRSYKRIKDFFIVLIGFYNKYLDEPDEAKIEKDFLDSINVPKGKFAFLNPLESPVEINTNRATITSERKSYMFTEKILSNPPFRCGICNGYMDEKSQNADHVKTVNDKGTGSVPNLQPAHWKCNSLKNDRSYFTFHKQYKLGL